jgi:glycosyltransferase involved in cell wall biosynthesis
MMQVLIDALAAFGGGSSTYYRSLLPTLGKVGPENEYWVLRAPWQDLWNFELPGNVHLLEVPLLKQRSVPRRVLWEQLRMPTLIRKYGIDVLLSPADITSLLAPCPVVLEIRNSNPYLGGSLSRGWRYYIDRKIVLRSLTWASARKATCVIFVSDFSRSVIVRQLHIPQHKTHVVYHGLNPIFCNPSPAVPAWLESLPRPYLLSVSSISAHKNYPFLVCAFADMARHEEFRHHLVIAGAHTFQKHVDEMQQIAEQAGLRGRLHLLGQINYNELPALYRQADLFVFPSLLETFGHPLVEAMASGVPVVVSNSTAIPEICADGALYFDPTDVGDAVMKISQVLADHALRQHLVAKSLARAAEFSWEQTARKTLEVLRMAVS